MLNFNARLQPILIFQFLNENILRFFFLKENQQKNPEMYISGFYVLSI